MLSIHELQTIAGWIKYCKILSQDSIEQNAKRLDIDADFKAVILIEQRRRVRELGKLEKAIENEIRLQRKGAS